MRSKRLAAAPASLLALTTSGKSGPSADWTTSYLNLLGLEREPPGLEFLQALTRAHVLRVPFENVTSILRRAGSTDRPVPPLDREAELGAWRAGRGGGLCFEVVDMFGALLASLGFQTHAVLATISFVGSHQGLVVDLAGERYLVDAGNGAPLFEPIRIEPGSAPVTMSRAGLSYRFRSIAEHRLVQDRLIDGEWQPFCTYDLSPASDAGRADAFQRHHVRGHSWVVDNLTLVRCTDAEVWSLRDDRLNHFTSSGKTTSVLESETAYREAAADLFGLPAAPIEQALTVLRKSA